tara:strand:- start:181 stop:435 length:255 start_codon:yes stop_codon:yes gene_type:complete
VGIGFLEADDRFAGFGEAELFAGITFHGLGVIAHGLDSQFAAFGGLLLGGDFLFQPKDFRAHALVLFDEREIPNGDSDQRGNDE